MGDKKVAVIEVRIKQSGGRFYASSPDIPGLNVCASSLKDLRDDIGPMIERMYALNHNLKVKTAPAVDPVSFKAPKPAARDFFQFLASPMLAAA